MVLLNIVNDISDHLPVFLYTSLDSFSASNNRPSTISVRDFSEKNVSNFCTHLLGVNWAAFLNNDANESYDKFISEYSRLYNVFFPLKTIKLTSAVKRALSRLCSCASSNYSHCFITNRNKRNSPRSTFQI